MLMLVKLTNKVKTMVAKLIQGKFVKKQPDRAKPMVSMFLVRRHDKFKVITNMAQLSPKELVQALVRDAVWNEREDAVFKRIVE
jgi:hypothetical protein